MRGSTNFLVLLALALALSPTLVFAGLAAFNPYEDRVSGKFVLEHASTLLRLASNINSSVKYKFSVTWILMPGTTNITVAVVGLECPGSGYTLNVTINDLEPVLAQGDISLTIERRSPILFMVIDLTIPGSCRVAGGVSSNAYIRVEAVAG